MNLAVVLIERRALNVCIVRCSQGKFAKKHDWVQAFGVQDDAEVCRLILDQGELQVSEGERKAQVEKCVQSYD